MDSIKICSVLECKLLYTKKLFNQQPENIFKPTDDLTRTIWL